MDYEDILKKLAGKVYHPVYFLTGEEPYYIDLISDAIEEKILDESEREFNLTILYGKDVDIPTIINQAKRFPMMSNYQVVIVKEAQDIKDIKEIEKLQPYVENPVKSTILVFCYKYKKLDKRKSITKLIEKHGVLFESPRIYDNQVSGWITQYLKKKGYGIQAKAAELLAESLGTSISKIVNEVNKMIINIPVGTEINAHHVEQNIGISKDFNVFELSKALETKNVVKANNILLHFVKNEKEFPIVMVVAILYTSFVRILQYHYLQDKSPNNVGSVLGIKPFFADDYRKAASHYSPARVVGILSLLREYDMKGKGLDANTGSGELMKEMVYKILHPTPA